MCVHHCVGEGNNKLSYKMPMRNHDPRFCYLEEWKYVEHRNMFHFEYQSIWLFAAGYRCALATQFPYFLARSYLVLSGKVSRPGCRDRLFDRTVGRLVELVTGRESYWWILDSDSPDDTR